MVIPPLLADIDRIISALKLAGLPKPYLENLSLLVKNGVHGNIIDLVKLPGVGRKRASALIDRGIKTPQDILKNPKVSENILGPKVFIGVKRAIESPGEVILTF